MSGVRLWRVGSQCLFAAILRTEFGERGWNGAELAAIAHEASLLAVRGFVESGKDPHDEKALSKAKVTPRHLKAAFDKVAARRL